MSLFSSRLIVGVAACIFLALSPGCTNSLPDRSLIFSTATTLGVEVSANPANTTGPVTLVAGYKRFEGVMNPVYYNHRSKGSADSTKAAPGTTTTTTTTDTTTTIAATNDVDHYYRDKAYSVIAKFEGSAKGKAGDAEAGVTGLSQWFATGEAATKLAASGASAVLTDNPQVAAAVSRNEVILKQLMDENTALEDREKLVKWMNTDVAGFDFLRARIKSWWAAADATTKDEVIDITKAYADSRGVDATAIIDPADSTKLKPDGLPVLIDSLDYSKTNHRLFLEEFSVNVEAFDTNP